MEAVPLSHAVTSHPKRRISSYQSQTRKFLLLPLLWVMLAAIVAVLVPGTARADTRTFNSASGAVPIPAGADINHTAGKAGTYPITTFVSGVGNQVIRKATVKLRNVIHTYPDDLDVLLVAPDGTNLVLMSDTGGDATHPLNGVDLVFDDAAAGSLPDSTQITTGTYKPTNISAGDPFAFPAPAASASTMLSTFNGINPSGTWGLYVIDDNGGDFGSISGFELTLELYRPSTDAAAIDLPTDNAAATIYPSKITFSGLTGTVSDVVVHLNGLSHEDPTDIDMLLVSPTGQKVQLLSDVGGTIDVTNLNIDITTAASGTAPVAGPLVSGSYKPTNSGAVDVYPSTMTVTPPAGPYGTSLTDFNGFNPNGDWSLYVADDGSSGHGSLASWSLSITTTPPVVQFSDPSYSVSEGVGTASFTITRNSSGGESRVSYSAGPPGPLGTATGTSNNPFTAGNDYRYVNSTAIFADGETSKTIFVPINQDSRDEEDETFILHLSTPVEATVGPLNDVPVIITDDDDPPTITLSGATVTEGNAGTTLLKFPYTQSAISEKPLSIQLSAVPGTATAGADYVAAPSYNISIPAGNTALSGTVDVTVNGDTLHEENETLTLNLSGVANAVVAGAGAQGVIVNDDASPTVSIADANISEGNGGSTNLDFTVSLSAASALPISVGYSTSEGTATAGSDFTPALGQLVFSPGVTSRVISVPVNGDVEIETDETFLVNLTAAGILADGQAVGTIVNDDTTANVPAISVANITTVEGNSGTTNATFSVKLSVASAQTVSVEYTTAAGTATSGTDYAPTSGTLFFAPGETTASVNVPVIGDTDIEPNETYQLNLSRAVNAIVTTASATATITNDDAVPAPQLLLYTPTSGLRGTFVTLVGLNLQGITNVKFNGVSTTFIVNSPTRITAKVPANATTGKITITTAGGTATSSGNYTVILPPTLTGFTPASGPSGTTVTLTGTNLSGVRTVKFNGVIAQFTAVSATKVTAKVPVLATSGKIELTTLAGKSTTAGTFKVTPKIVTLSPATGAPGSLVIIDGLSFLSTSSVKFNGVTAQFTQLSATRLRATVPASATTGKVTVTTPGGTATSAGNFTVTGSAPAQPQVAVASGLSYATTQAATGVVSLHFTAAIDAETAGDVAAYSVAVNGEAVAIESISVNGAVVSLVLPDGALQSGDCVSIQWRGLRDSNGRALGGTTGVTAK